MFSNQLIIMITHKKIAYPPREHLPFFSSVSRGDINKISEERVEERRERSDWYLRYSTDVKEIKKGLYW